MITVTVLLLWWAYLTYKFNKIQRTRGDKISMSIVIFLLMIIVFSFVSLMTSKATIESKPIYIQSFGSEESWQASGVFALGFGILDGGSSSNYYIYANTRNGLERVKLPTDRVYIVEDENEKPHIKNGIIIIRTVYSKLWGIGFLEYLQIRLSDVKYFNNYKTANRKIIMHVPKNTVVKKFTVD
jgi:hypothetical protein